MASDVDTTRDIRLRAEEAFNLCSTQHRRMIEDHAFASGRQQWEKEVIEDLKRSNRPALTISDLWARLERASALGEVRETNLRASAISDEFEPIADGIDRLFRYVSDPAAVVAAQALRDAMKGGIGVARREYDPSVNRALGTVIPLRRLLPWQVLWDPYAYEPGLADRRYSLTGSYASREDVIVSFPESELAERLKKQKRDGIQATGSVVSDWQTFFSGDTTRTLGAPDVFIINAEYVDVETRYTAVVPSLGIVLDEDSREGLRQAIAMALASGANSGDIRDGEYDLRVIKSVTMAEDNSVLREEIQRNFRTNFITGIIDSSVDDGESVEWFGIVNFVKDGTRWFNKFVSMGLTLLATKQRSGFALGPSANAAEFMAALANPMKVPQVTGNDDIVPLPQTQPEDISPWMEFSKGARDSAIGLSEFASAGGQQDLRRISSKVVREAVTLGDKSFTQFAESVEIFRRHDGVSALELGIQNLSSETLSRIFSYLGRIPDYQEIEEALAYGVIIETVSGSNRRELEDIWQSITTSGGLDVFNRAGIPATSWLQLMPVEKKIKDMLIDGAKTGSILNQIAAAAEQNPTILQAIQQLIAQSQQPQETFNG